MRENGSRQIKSKAYRELDYQTRKRVFWTLLIIAILLILFILYYLLFGYSPYETRETQLMIRAAICGCVHKRAVYDMPVNSILSDLIRKAGGVKPNADLSKVNLATILQHDSVYHVPCRGKKLTGRLPSLELKVSKPAATPMPVITDKHFNIFYAGLPHTFMLIQIFPDLDLISITHIPFYTNFTIEKQRLGDYFFLMGVSPTVYLIQNFMREKIDFYLVQDRNSFIKMIDFMGGMTVDVDTLFAKEYNLTAGRRHLSGFYSWEYIRFIDVETRKSSLFIGSQYRLERQKHFMMAMYQKFKTMNLVDQAQNVREVLKLSQTNLTYGVVKSLIETALKMRNPKLELLTLPGAAIYENDVLYWQPDLNAFNGKRKQLIQSYGGMLNGNKKINTMADSLFINERSF